MFQEVSGERVAALIEKVGNLKAWGLGSEAW